MSEFRKGVCKDCSAEFNIPASFTHDRAKCRQCGGTVEIAPAKGAAPAPKPVPAAVPPAPKPKAPEPKPEPVAEEPAEKPMTMKEKIVARKKAEAEAAAAAAKPAAPAKKATPVKKAAPKAKAAPGAKRAKPAAAAAGGSRKKAGGKKSAKRGKRGAADEGEEGGRRGRREKPEKKAPVAGIIGVIALVAGGAGAWYFLMGPGKTEAKKTDTVANAEIDEPVVMDEELTAEEEAAAKAAEEKAAEEAAAAKAEEEAAAAKKEEAAAAPPEEKVYDPSTITYDDIPVFGAAIGTTDEEWTEIQDLAATAIDMTAGARQGRANRKLLEYGYKAFPAICNSMREIDLSTNAGYRAGDLMQRNIMELMNGINMGWNYDTEEDGTPTLQAQVFNRKVVRIFLGQWNKAVEDPIYWIGAAKLERNPDALKAYQDALDNAGVEPEEDLGLDDF